jgi:hypothetical protein
MKNILQQNSRKQFNAGNLRHCQTGKNKGKNWRLMRKISKNIFLKNGPREAREQPIIALKGNYS